MTAGDNYITLPNFLIPYRDGGVEDYTDAPETVGKIVLAVASKLFKRADISENLSPCERGVYRHWLKVAEDGLEKATREREKMKKAAAARWGNPASGEPPQAANPSPSGGRPPAPVRQTGTPQGAPVPARSPQAANPSPSGGRPPAPVRQTGTPQAHPSGGERRGGVKSIGECFDMAAMFGGAGGGIADRITAEPVRAALEITGEPSGGIAENTLKKYLRTKGRNAFCDTLFAFHSEIKNGEDVGNRGAALNARLKALPDNPAGR